MLSLTSPFTQSLIRRLAHPTDQPTHSTIYLPTRPSIHPPAPHLPNPISQPRTHPPTHPPTETKPPSLRHSIHCPTHAHTSPTLLLTPSVPHAHPFAHPNTHPATHSSIRTPNHTADRPTQLLIRSHICSSSFEFKGGNWLNHGSASSFFRI